MAKSTEKRHYSMDKLLADYTSTYSMFMGALAIAIGAVLIYFFLFVVYLGGWSHNPHHEAHEQFKDRFEIDYKGTKLPAYEN